MEENTLTDRVKNGDSEALTEFYRQMQPKLVKWVAIQIKDNQLAEDLTNEAFIKLLRQHQTISGKSIEQLRSWIYSTCHRTLLDHIRKRNRRVTENTLEGVEDTTIDPTDFSIEIDEIGTVNKIINTLTESQSRAFILYMYGFTHPEIARAMDTSVGAVNQLILRAKRNLRKELQ